MLDKEQLNNFLQEQDTTGAAKYLHDIQKTLTHNDLLYLQRLYESESRQTGRQPLKLSILRTYTVETMVPYLEVLGRINGFEPEIHLGGYGQVFQEVLETKSGLYQTAPDIVFILTRLQDLQPDIMHSFLRLTPEQLNAMSRLVSDNFRGIISTLRQNLQGPLVISNFIIPAYPSLGILDATTPQGQTRILQQLNASLAEIVAGNPNCYILDLETLAGRHGKERFADPRMYYVSRAPFSRGGFRLLSLEILRFIKVTTGKTKKCIVLDCDNTLWGGITGEDGIDGIQLGPDYPGACFVEFQRQLLSLINKGFILAINSKNNENDVIEVLQKHPHQVLREEHFACIKANWENKANNMHAIAAELNLGTDSFIYFDDDPAQCKLIEDNMPEVMTVQMPREPVEVTGLLNDIDELEILSLTEEDKLRPKLYKEEARRKQLQISTSSLDDYYESLEMEMDVLHNPPSVVPRLAQITQRTKQFNLTTHRYSETDIVSFINAEDHEIYAFTLRDIFGDSGLVGEAIFKRIEPDTYEIDSLLMSCRVIGRTTEESFLNYCLEQLKEMGVQRVIARYLPTKKNELVDSFYDRVGFQLLSQGENGEKLYESSLAYWQPPASKWIKVNAK